MPSLALIGFVSPLLFAHAPAPEALRAAGLEPLAIPHLPQAAASDPALAPISWSLHAQAQAEVQQTDEDTSPPSDEPEPTEGTPIIVEGTYGPPEGDPLERVNAESFRITQAIDEALVGPLAYAYRDGLPEPVRDGLGNVVRNIGEPNNAFNFLLQLKIGKMFETLGRFAINSTLGVGGLFDLAKRPRIGLPYRRNGFANTMGFYGVGPGPYLYLPVTGATTVRDVIGSGLDQAFLPVLVGDPFNRIEYVIPYFVINSLDARLALDAEIAEIRASDDPYAVRRDTYLAQRKAQIAALRGEAIAEPEPEADEADEADELPATLPDQPPLSLVEQIQLTARSTPATR